MAKLKKILFATTSSAICNDASKVAFVHLVMLLQHWGFDMVDCQITTSHLIRFGAHEGVGVMAVPPPGSRTSRSGRDHPAVVLTRL